MLWQPPLPERYTRMAPADLAAAIRARKSELGDKLVILGHHYQQDDVIQFADFTGDSFKLSQLAAERVRQAGAKYVIFLGVHFMAESADILTPDDVAVILPDMGAGCSMADMADYDETVDAWEQIAEATRGTGVRVIPVCYMNSSAAIKSFVGEHGGAVCTSSNCDKVFKWALAGGEKPLPPSPLGERAGVRGETSGLENGSDVGADPEREGFTPHPNPLPKGRGGQTESIKILFIPDQHLGRNTAAAMGYDVDEDMIVWDPKSTAGMGGNSEEDVRRATFVLWKGHCSVHKLFRPEHVDQAREQCPPGTGVTVIVHPECQHEVVLRSDLTGSTEGIIKAIEMAAPESRWAVGTEVHLVTRLAREAAKRGVHVEMLSGCQCLCTTMYRIDMPHLLWVMDNLTAGKIVNQIKVHPQVKHWSLAALDRMLKITADANRAVVAKPPEVQSPQQV